jgi:hypothetical protein
MTVGREEGVSKTTEGDKEEEKVYQRPMVCRREEGIEEASPNPNREQQGTEIEQGRREDAQG